MHEQEGPTLRSYVRVVDLEASMQRAEESGAQIILGAMEIPGRGRIAIYTIGGIEQGIWQLP
jgi:predicted enzyme related to lactoylglutathione lyase